MDMKMVDFPVEYRCEGGHFRVYASCMNISNPASLRSSGTLRFAAVEQG